MQDQRPVVYAFVAKQQIGGWWTDFDLIPRMDALQLVQEHEGWHMLVDPRDEEELGTWERANLPHNQPRWYGSTGE